MMILAATSLSGVVSINRGGVPRTLQFEFAGVYMPGNKSFVLFPYRVRFCPVKVRMP